MAQVKRKFKNGDIVFDGYNKVIGVVSGYLGRGIYTLENVAAPFYDSTGNIQHYIKVNPCIMDPKSFGVEGESGYLFLQTSRYLIKPAPDLLHFYQERLVDTGKEEVEIYYYDGYQNILRLGEITAEYRGGYLPIVYDIKTRIQERWAVNGYMLGGRPQDLKSVVKIDGGQAWRISLDQINYSLSRKDVEFVFNWEAEFGPYIIQGLGVV